MLDAIHTAANVPAAEVVDPTSLSDIVLGQGLVGAICVALVYFILMLRTELRDVRSAHKTEIAAKDALINELQEERLKEAKAGFDAMRSVQATMDAFLSAIRQGGK